MRGRDGRCVLTRTENRRARAGIWDGFEAAHIFPLAYEQHWIDHDFSRWISLPPSQGGAINSVQNGLLLLGSIRTDFDRYNVSVNPDVGFFSLVPRFRLSLIKNPRITIRSSAFKQICMESREHSWTAVS